MLRARSLRAFAACLLSASWGTIVGAQSTASSPSASQPASTPASQPAEPVPFSAETFAGLSMRLVGTALTGGRIADIAVNPTNYNEYFIAVASGGVWKTSNGGVTWAPVFDGEGSYSIGCVTIDPQNPFTVWVGTGENNSQRSVGWVTASTAAATAARAGRTSG